MRKSFKIEINKKPKYYVKVNGKNELINSNIDAVMKLIKNKLKIIQHVILIIKEK